MPQWGKQIGRFVISLQQIACCFIGTTFCLNIFRHVPAYLFHDDKYSIPYAPHDETPRRAMPKPCDQEHDEQIGVAAQISLPVSTKRDVYVFPEPR